jgi:hypothetical protein
VPHRILICLTSQLKFLIFRNYEEVRYRSVDADGLEELTQVESLKKGGQPGISAARSLLACDDCRVSGWLALARCPRVVPCWQSTLAAVPS